MGDERKPKDPADADAELWARAMADVRPLGERRPAVKAPRRAAAAPAPAAPPVPPEAFEDLVARHSPFDVEESGETITARVPDLDYDILRRLRGGAIPPENRLDLHGLMRTEAEPRLVRFIEAERAAGRRCVLVIHGRGNGSDRGPVLRDLVRRALARPPLAGHVLAFTSAVPRDGGPGALYVLLRRRGGR